MILSCMIQLIDGTILHHKHYIHLRIMDWFSDVDEVHRILKPFEYKLTNESVIEITKSINDMLLDKGFDIKVFISNVQYSESEEIVINFQVL